MRKVSLLSVLLIGNISMNLYLPNFWLMFVVGVISSIIMVHTKKYRLITNSINIVTIFMSLKLAVSFLFHQSVTVDVQSIDMAIMLATILITLFLMAFLAMKNEEIATSTE